nr:hypothetical protein [Desulfobulbaceae bacterium]
MLKSILLILLAITSLTTTKALSHIEHGGMPDSVAEMEYRILLEFEPLKHDVRNKLGNVLLRLKKFKEAKDEFLIVLAEEPNDLQAQIGLGQILMHEEKWLEAENTFLGLQKRYSENIELSYLLGTLYKDTGKIPEAEQIFVNLLKKVQFDQGEESTHWLEKITEVLADIKKKAEVPSSNSSL